MRHHEDKKTNKEHPPKLAALIISNPINYYVKHSYFLVIIEGSFILMVASALKEDVFIYTKN
jgi:hypothetical protein